MLALRSQWGCGNADCRVHKPLGMNPNSVCRCTPARLSGIHLELAAWLESLGEDWSAKEAKP
jgi:hypothetical protein